MVGLHLFSDTHPGTKSRPLIRSKARVIPVKIISRPARVGAGSKAKLPALESSSSSGLDGESDASSDSEPNESNNDKVTSGSTLRGTRTEEITVAVSPKSESEGKCSLRFSISHQRQHSQIRRALYQTPRNPRLTKATRNMRKMVLSRRPGLWGSTELTLHQYPNLIHRRDRAKPSLR